MKKTTAIIMGISLALNVLLIFVVYLISNASFQIANWVESLLGYAFTFVFPALVGVTAGWNVKNRGVVIFIAPMADAVMQLIVFHGYFPFAGIIMFTVTAVSMFITAMILYFIRKKRRIDE